MPRIAKAARTTAVPIVLGQHAMDLARTAGVDTAALTVWARPGHRGFASASFTRPQKGHRPVPTLVFDQGVAREPNWRFYLAHEVAHLALGHGRVRGGMRACLRQFLPFALGVVSLVGFVVASVVLPPVAPAMFWLMVVALLLDSHWHRQREYAADAYAATRLGAWMTDADVATIRRREGTASRRWFTLPFRSHPLPERRLAAVNRLQPEQP